MTTTAEDESRTHSIRHKTLSAYYPVLHHFQDFLHFPLIRTDDTPEFRTFIETALIAIKSVSVCDELKIHFGQLTGSEGYVRDREGPGRGYKELVDVIIEEVARRGKNILSMVPKDVNRTFEEVMPGQQRHKTSLHSANFRTLRSRLGDLAFRRFIVHTSIYLPVGNNSFVQITGQPLFDLPPLSKQSDLSIKKRKRGNGRGRGGKKRKVEGTNGKRPSPGILGNGQSLADVQIARQRMFYGHPATSADGRSLAGLHPQHVLNICSAQSVDTEGTCERMLQAIFPRYRLESVEEPVKPRTANILAALQALMERHRKIDCDKLLRICVTRAHDHTFDGLQPISHSQVGRFITAILRQIHGGMLFGSDDNLQKICRHAKRLIEAKQFEPITLHSLLVDIKVSDFRWLSSESPQSATWKRPNLAESRKQQELVQQFIFWLFDDYLVPLIRNSFYVTETASTRYQTVYYAHDEWSKASKPHFAKLQEDLLEPLTIYEQAAAGQNQFGVSAVRLIPKPNGFRPIVNLGRRVAAVKGLHRRPGKKTQTANETLRGIHQVLTYEKERNRVILGSSLFGTNEIFAPLNGLKTELFKLYGHLPRLYFVKMDIKAAFDTIKQDGVLRVIEQILEQDWGYALVQYCLMLPPASAASQGSSRKLFKTRAVVEGENALVFNELAKDIARPLRNAIVVDIMRKQTQSRQELMSLLRQHIQQNIWQIGGRYCRQREGIPQGSKISSMLCSIFYAALEREHLEFLTKPGSRLLRYIDDFLYITDDFAAAKRFSAIMNNGFPKYGAFISPGKTMTSFEYTRGQVAPICPLQPDGTSHFPYCGFMIDTKTLEIKPDVSRMIAGDMAQSFALRNARHRGKAFVGWLSRQLENRNHLAYLDTTHNNLDVVYLNIWLNFATTAMKIPHYFDSSENIPPRFARIIFELICSSVEYSYVAGRARVRHAARNAPDSREHYKVNKADFEYLAKSAVVKILTKKAGRFKDVLHSLKDDLGRQEYRVMRQRHRMTEIKGWEQVKMAKY